MNRSQPILQGGQDRARMSVSTFRDVTELIEERRRVLTGHGFLRLLEGHGNLQQVRGMVALLAFFTLAFQDVLRATRQRCSDPQMQAIARSLELGDKGHDRWFLEDMRRLDLRIDIEQLFGEAHEASRAAAYAILAYVLTTPSDHARVAVLLSLEAAAHEFFVRVPGFAARAGVEGDLKYFGVVHLEAEESHEVFEHDAQAELARAMIPRDMSGEVLRAVDVTFTAMTSFADSLHTTMSSARSESPAPPSTA